MPLILLNQEQAKQLEFFGIALGGREGVPPTGKASKGQCLTSSPSDPLNDTSHLFPAMSSLPPLPPPSPRLASPTPPPRNPNEVDYYIVGAVVCAVIAVPACLVYRWLVVFFVPIVIVLAVIALRRSAEKVAVMKAETDHLRPYQRIVDLQSELARLSLTISETSRNAQTELTQTNEQRKALQAECDALRHYIEGYGDAFVIPTHSLIDQIGEDYGHTLAGEKLSGARAHTRTLIREHRAILSQIADKNQKKAVERVFLTAFNGDVEDVLNRAKHDNFGKLQQELLDTRELLNKNGVTLGTSITKEFLESRIEELRWLVIVQELRKRAADEQREIRERMREEERAAREFAKAQVDAAKEAKRIEEEFEKNRAAAALAAANAKTEEQREKFEQQLAALNAAHLSAIADVEARNQRAISMAQQTRSGTVYIISNVGSFGEEVFKIGMTRRLDPQERVDELGDASVPFEFDVHAFIETTDAPGLENRLHRQFNERRLNKVNLRKEFFRLTASEIRDALGDDLKTTQFTMLAEAKEYRESLALARSS